MADNEKEKATGHVHAGTAVIITTADARAALYADESAVRVTGYSLSELCSMSFMDLVASESRPAFMEGIKGLSELRRLYSFFVSKQGVRLPVVLTLAQTVWKGALSLMVVFCGAHWNIDLEEAPEKAMDRLSRTQAIARVGIFDWDIDRDEILLSDELYRIFGVPVGTIFSFEDMAGFFYPEDAASVKKAVEASLMDGRPFKMEHRLVRPDGLKMYVHVEGSVEFDLLHRPVRMIGAILDMTERRLLDDELKRASDEIEDLYNNAPCGYHSLDKDGVFLRINDTELKWLGYTRQELIGRMKITDIYTPEGKAIFAREFQVFMDRGYVKDLELELTRKDGTTFPVLLSATTVRDGQGRFVRTRSISYDITERKKMEDELKRANKELSDALANVKVLSGLIPICASCKRIKNEKGFWDSVEKYISEHTEAEFSHGFCSDCAKKLYPAFYDKKL